MTAPNQIVHGDLHGNVLFAGDAAPAVVDLTPYWRPGGWAIGVLAVDAVAWVVRRSSCSVNGRTDRTGRSWCAEPRSSGSRSAWRTRGRRRTTWSPCCPRPNGWTDTCADLARRSPLRRTPQARSSRSASAGADVVGKLAMRRISVVTVELPNSWRRIGGRRNRSKPSLSRPAACRPGLVATTQAIAANRIAGLGPQASVGSDLGQSAVAVPIGDRRQHRADAGGQGVRRPGRAGDQHRQPRPVQLEHPGRRRRPGRPGPEQATASSAASATSTTPSALTSASAKSISRSTGSGSGTMCVRGRRRPSIGSSRDRSPGSPVRDGRCTGGCRRPDRPGRPR